MKILYLAPPPSPCNFDIVFAIEVSEDVDDAGYFVVIICINIHNITTGHHCFRNNKQQLKRFVIYSQTLAFTPIVLVLSTFRVIKA